MCTHLRNVFIKSNCTILTSMVQIRLLSISAQEEYLKSMIANINPQNGIKKLQVPEKSEDVYQQLKQQDGLEELRPPHNAHSKQLRTNLSNIDKTVLSNRTYINVKKIGTVSPPSNIFLQKKSSAALRSHLAQSCSVSPDNINLQTWDSNHSTPIVPVKSVINPSESIMSSISSLRQWFKTLNLNALEPLPQPATNLAAYVPNSFTLTQLTRLGVNLSKIETLPGVANMLVKMDFKTDIEPFLWTLSDFGFDPNQMARILTVFPKVLKLELDELKSRIVYFLDHGFPPIETVDIIHKQPLILQETSIQIDQILGQIQSLFEFEGKDIRNVVIAEPKVAIHPMGKIKDIYVILTKAMGFSIATCQNLVRSCPKLLTTERDRISTNFVIMHSRLNLSTELIQLWPEALVASPLLLTERSSLLVSRNLFQPDPKKPLYTPLGTIVSLKDEEFCRRFGRISEDEYDHFLRTL